MQELFLQTPYGTETHKLADNALKMWRKLGCLNYKGLVGDTYLTPEMDIETQELLPIEMEFIDGIYLCSGQYKVDVNLDGEDQLFLHGIGRRIYRGLYGSIQEG